MTYAASEQSVQGGAPLELYRFSVGRASLQAVAGDTTTEDLSEDFDQYVGPQDDYALAHPGETLPPSGAPDPTGLTNVWGLVGGGDGGHLVLELDGLEGGDRSIALRYYNQSFEGQYFGGLYAYRVFTGFVVGERYTATAVLNANWDFLDPNVQGPCGWGLFGITTSDAPGAPAGAGNIGANGEVTFTFVAHETSYQGWFGFTYGNSNWNTTLPYPRILQCQSMAFERVTNNGDTDPTVFTPTVYNYTSADVPVVYNGDTYVPAILIRSQFQRGNAEKGGAEVELTLPRDHALATIAGGGPPRLPVSVEVIRLHRSDLTAAAFPWRGQVVGARFEGTSCTIRIASLRSLLDRKVPRYLTQKTCGHMLYDSLCQASRQANTVGPLTVSAIAGRVVTITGAATAAAGRVTGFAGGYLEAPNGLAFSIETVDGDDLTLKTRPLGLAVSNAVQLIFGCDKRPETCAGDFHNMRHYGGEPVLPLRNPGTGAGLVGSGS